MNTGKNDPQLNVGDRVQMRKPHPCGGDQWEIYRLGADIGIRCLTCDRRVMLARSEFLKRLKRVLSRPNQTQNGDDNQ